MPRNPDTHVYVSVPIRKDSTLLAHLKEEAQQARGHKRIQLGPYVATLLEERDRQLSGQGEGKAFWFSSYPASLSQLIEAAVHKAMISILPSLCASLPALATAAQTMPECVEESPEEAMEQEAAALAASLRNGGWGCDDEDQEREKKRKR